MHVWIFTVRIAMVAGDLIGVIFFQIKVELLSSVQILWAYLNFNAFLFGCWCLHLIFESDMPRCQRFRWWSISTSITVLILTERRNIWMVHTIEIIVEIVIIIVLETRSKHLLLHIVFLRLSTYGNWVIGPEWHRALFMLRPLSITSTFSQAILETECLLRPFFPRPHTAHIVRVSLVPLKLNLPLPSNYRLDAVFICVWNIFVILMILMKQTVL